MRRVIAAMVGVILAVVGAVLVINYANGADARAAEGMERESVVVALEDIPVGTPVSEFGDRVEVRQIPRSALVDDAVTELGAVQDLVLTTAAVPGEQLTRARLESEEALRARGTNVIPEELANHHQITLLLDKANALGGNIAPGDTVGVFMSYEVDTSEDDSESDQDEAQPEPPTDEEGSPLIAGGDRVNLTDLTLHKVPVVRVEGAYVAPAVAGDGEGEGAAEDQIFVTLALEPKQAARVVFAAEWGSVYLSLEPEGAAEDEVPTIVITLPERGEDVLQ